MQTDMGAYIKALRLARGWSQDGLARRAKTTRPEVTKIESNPRPPTERMLARLVFALGGDIEEAFERAQYGRQRAVYWMDTLHQPPAADDALKVVADALDDGGWDRDVRKALVTLIRATRPHTSALRAIAEQRAAYEC